MKMKEEYTLNEINNKENKFDQLIIQIVGVFFLTIAISGCLYDCTNKALKADKYFYKKTYPEKNNEIDSTGQSKNEKEKFGFESAGNLVI
jgi:hypothetical protein